MEQVGAVKMGKGKRYRVLDSWRWVCACMVALFRFKTNSQPDFFIRGGPDFDPDANALFSDLGLAVLLNLYE